MTTATTSAHIPLIVGCTATRDGMVEEQAKTYAACLTGLKKTSPKREFHHGGCVGGDVQAAAMASLLGYTTVRHPGDTPAWHDLQWRDDLVTAPAPNLVRNRIIVMASAVVLAAPGGPERRRGSGTWATIRECRRTETPHVICWPNGSADLEMYGQTWLFVS